MSSPFPPATPSASPPQPLRVLIVEDSEDDALLLLRELRRAGYRPSFERVETAVAMEAALDHPVWDMVIADYSLPSFNALAALKLIQARQLDLPFIIVSGAIGEETAIAIMKAGAHDYLIKGNLARLGPAVERELREAQIRREKHQAETDLLRAYENLELLVQQRTAELQATNVRLQAEIDERTRAEESLHQLAAIVESSEDAIISMAPDGTIRSWNSGAEKMYGYTAAEALGHSISSLIRPKQASAASPIHSHQLEGLNCHETVHRRQDGRLIDVFLTVSLLRDSTGQVTGSSMIARDISERRVIERIKDEFVSIVSHELRTPLTSIRASLGLLLTGKLGELSQQGQRMLEIAVNNTDRLVRLINDILDLERLESGKLELIKEWCDVGHLMRQAVDVMHPMAEKSGVALRIEVEPTEAAIAPLTFEVDPDRLLQVLTNLLSNAIKFSPPQSTVSLRGTWITSHTLQTTGEGILPILPWDTPLPCLLIAVQDQGRGIPADKLETIFGRFQQVDASDSRQKGGTGLGLAICRTIVQQHGGRLWVESTLGVGSTFLISLPSNEPPLAIAPDPELLPMSPLD